MAEETVSKSRFKLKALVYLCQVQESGHSLIITDRGHPVLKPVLKIVPYTAEPEELLKSLRNTVLAYDEPTEPVGLEDRGTPWTPR